MILPVARTVTEGPPAQARRCSGGQPEPEPKARKPRKKVRSEETWPGLTSVTVGLGWRGEAPDTA